MYQFLLSGWPVSTMSPVILFARWRWSGWLVPARMRRLITALCDLQNVEGPMGPPGEMGKTGIPVCVCVCARVKVTFIPVVATNPFLTLCWWFFPSRVHLVSLGSEGSLECLGRWWDFQALALKWGPQVVLFKITRSIKTHPSIGFELSTCNNSIKLIYKDVFINMVVSVCKILLLYLI